MNLKQLRDERAEKFEKMQGVRAVAEGEKRGLSKEERDQWNTLKGELDELDAQISVEVDNLSVQARMASTSGQKMTGGNEEKELRQFSLIKFVRGAAYNKLEGFEQEMHQEAVKEARDNGVEIKNFGIPTKILESRDNTVTLGTQPADGSQLVKDDYKGMIDLLKDALVSRQLGATYLPGLKGNVTFDKLTQSATSSWKGEIDELDVTDVKFGSAEMKPNRLGTLARPSKQVLIQSTPAIEAMLRRELMESVALAVDKAAINGSGVGNEPLGVMNTPGIGSVAIGANGGAPLYQHIVGLENAVEVQNALLGNLKYLINPKVRAKLKLTKLDAGSGLFLMPGNTELNGYGAVSSNIIPSNLTKGTGTGLSPILFGNWSDLMIGQWGGLDIMADPYTLASSGRVRLIVDSFWDVFVRRAVSFAAIKDADTTL